MVLSNFNSFIRIYVGIIPPLKNIVKTIIDVKRVLPGNLFFDKGYAPNIVQNNVKTTPNKVLIIDMRAPDMINFDSKTRL